METRGERPSRLTGLDALRGAVMIIMALDHVRDFFHRDAPLFQPTNLSRTTPVLFFTRWITHFCLPVFLFAAGAGAFLWWQQRGHSRGELSRFLWTRGVWFALLELTVMQVAYDFNLPWRFPLFLLILWIFGLCFALMAGLVHLPERWLLALSVVIIVFSNCLDGIQAKQFGAWAPVWNIVHQPGVFTAGGTAMLAPYPILPWVGVMAAGFCFGRVLVWEPERRRRFMLRMGMGMIVAFVVLRGINRYGDPAPWAVQKSGVFTALSFLNCTKSPGSLDFLLMTLGPALVVLAYLDGRRFSARNPLIVFGRVPFFYFVLHFYIIHTVAAVMAWVRYGNASFRFLFSPVLSMGGKRELFPPDMGYSLFVAYLVWAAIVIGLYPLCRWYANVRATHRKWWLSYL